MSKETKRISRMWKEEYSSQIKKYEAFQISDQFKRLASLFSPGISYFYILNLYNIKLEYLSETVQEFIGMPPGEIKMEHLLESVIEIEDVENKEKVIYDFFNRFLEKGKSTDYKLIYSYKMKDHNGRERCMLLQANPLSVSENGSPQHILGVHTDISHLSLKNTKHMSFINLHGGQSFFKVNSEKGYFDESEASKKPSSLFESLTTREKQIVELLAKGYSTKKIAEFLNVSIHTVRTHRRNILSKCNLNNTAELVAESMMAGLIT